MQKILLITKKLEQSPRGGRELLCRLNYEAINQIFGLHLHLLELPTVRIADAKLFFNAFRGQIDGLNDLTLRTAFELIDRHNISKVFVDGSNLGGFAREIKRKIPGIEVTTFCHNVESRFFWGAFRTRKTARALAVIFVNFLAERNAARKSDKLICLSERDSRLFKRIYGRTATHISPIALEDKCPRKFFNSREARPDEFILFVGGMFYANQTGIAWFVQEVSPHINIPIYIVGRGLEALRAELEAQGKVTVVGAVDSLAEWYYRAKFVIAPIFDGSGMKTKVAEALMYGKKIVGTPEAFSGYEDVLPQAGWMCKTRDEFVSAIVEAQATITQCFDMSLRQIYEQRYSMTAATERLRQILS